MPSKYTDTDHDTFVLSMDGHRNEAILMRCSVDLKGMYWWLPVLRDVRMSRAARLMGDEQELFGCGVFCPQVITTFVFCSAEASQPSRLHHGCRFPVERVGIRPCEWSRFLRAAGRGTRDGKTRLKRLHVCSQPRTGRGDPPVREMLNLSLCCDCVQQAK